VRTQNAIWTILIFIGVVAFFIVLDNIVPTKEQKQAETRCTFYFARVDSAEVLMTNPICWQFVE